MNQTEMPAKPDREQVRERSQQIERLLKLRQDERKLLDQAGDVYVPMIENWFKILLAEQLEKSSYEVVAGQLESWLEEDKEPFLALLAQKIQLTVALENSLQSSAEEIVTQLKLDEYDGSTFQKLSLIRAKLSQLSKVAVASLS